MAAMRIVLYLTCIGAVLCTVDINVHHLQMISDHLEISECKKLSSALHQNTILLDKMPNGTDEPDKPCIFLLLQWDRKEGVGKTFNDLALRLRQIGRNDLANRLAKSVYGDETHKLERNFLSDPFKKAIAKNSFALAGKKKRKKRKRTSKAEAKGLSPLEIVSIVCGAITGCFVIGFIIYKLFGSAINRVFRKFAPEFIVTWVDLVTRESRWFCVKQKRNYEKNVIGRRNGTTASSSSVTDMNKNLNNCMRGSMSDEDRMFYFRDL